MKRKNLVAKGGHAASPKGSEGVESDRQTDLADDDSPVEGAPRRPFAKGDAELWEELGKPLSFLLG